MDIVGSKRQPARMAVAQAMRSARKGRHTQETLALKVGVDQATVSRWETERQEPTLDEIAAVEEACGRPRGWILVTAGLVQDVPSVELAIAADDALSDDQKEFVLNAYRGGLRLSGSD